MGKYLAVAMISACFLAGCGNSISVREAEEELVIDVAGSDFTSEATTDANKALGEWQEKHPEFRCKSFELTHGYNNSCSLKVKLGRSEEAQTVAEATK